MKKIIKNGNIPETQASCPVCGCEFMYDRPEAVRTSSHDYEVECPCCKAKLKIHYDNLVSLKLL